MDSIRLYEIKFEQYEKEIKELQKKVDGLELKLGEAKEEVRKWNRKYKELKETLTK